MKALITYKRFILASIGVFILLWTGCASSNEGGNRSAQNERQNSQSSYFRNLENGFSVAPQQTPPPFIRSVTLYKSANRRSAPFIELDSGESVTLEFDYMDTDARQFTVQVEHRTPLWKESILSRNFYQKGLYEDQISDSFTSSSQHPSYQHYRYSFPNEDIQLKVSGNYLITVSSFDTGKPLFSLPFFVYENEGQLRTSVQHIPAPPKSIRMYHQLFGNYFYPDFVRMPQFELSFYFVQNQFWGRFKKADVRQNIQDKIDFHISRNNSFIADYGFKFLNMTELSADGVNIRGYQPGHQPPHIILRRDIQNLSPVTDASRTARHGFPSTARDAKYAEVFFYLETAVRILPEDKIYVTGDFNNWTINEQNKMEYDVEEEAWVGNALIKQGQYTYKYVLVRNGTIQDMLLDNSFSLARQQYFGLTYYEDPDMNYHRLLQINSLESN